VDGGGGLRGVGESSRGCRPLGPRAGRSIELVQPAVRFIGTIAFADEEFATTDRRADRSYLVNTPDGVPMAGARSGPPMRRFPSCSPTAYVLCMGALSTFQEDATDAYEW